MRAGGGERERERERERRLLRIFSEVHVNTDYIMTTESLISTCMCMYMYMMKKAFLRIWSKTFVLNCIVYFSVETSKFHHDRYR